MFPWVLSWSTILHHTLSLVLNHIFKVTVKSLTDTVLPLNCTAEEEEDVNVLGYFPAVASRIYGCVSLTCVLLTFD